MDRLRRISLVLWDRGHWADSARRPAFLCASPGVRAQETGTGAGSGAPAASSSQSPQGTAASEASAKAQSDTKSEISTQDTGTTFKLRVNLVQVHVTVRDGKGNPIPNLKREDFQVFDQGKLQPITVFAVETRESRREKALAAAKTQADASDPGESKTVLPDRFVAMEFDDIHLVDRRRGVYQEIRGAVSR